MTTLVAIHTVSILAVIAMFFVRGIGTIFEKEWIGKKIFKIAPHIIDTLMLITGITLVIMSGLSFTQDWILVKIVGVIAYVFFALMAFKKAKTRNARAMFWLGGLITLFYLVAVAKHHSVWPF